MNKVGLVVADDHPLVLRGMLDCLSALPQINILASCHDGFAALEAINAFDPDVALLDVVMPRLTGLEVLAALNQRAHRTRIILLSAQLDQGAITTAIADGAAAFLLKECSVQQLQQCIVDVANGRRFFPLELAVRQATGEALTDSGPLEQRLSEREWQVMKNAAQGLSNKEIARLLDITEGTVKVHLHQIFKKLGVANRTALANFTYRYRS